ncbi:MAG: ATPase, T2SS/T4P/T4SS family [Bacillota bacterium]|nr:ATPase, T2SS/T4P/T4SS family [Bacillota bacterium]
MGINQKAIDEILLESGLITIEQLKNVWEEQRETQKDIVDILVQNELIPVIEIMKAKAKRLGVEYLDLESFEIKDINIPLLVNENVARRNGLIAVDKDETTLTVAMKNPDDIFAIDDLKLCTNMEIKPVLADENEVDKLIEKFYERPVKTRIEKPVFKEERIEEFNPYDLDMPYEKAQVKPQNKFSFEEEDESSTGVFKVKIGRLLIDSGLLTENQLEEALKEQAENGGRLGEILIKSGHIDKKLLYELLEKQMEIPYINLEETEILDDVASLISENIARRDTIIPVLKEGNVLKVAMNDPLNIFSIDDMRLATGLEIIPLLADTEQINAAIDKYFRKNKKARSKDDSKKFIDFDEEIEKVNKEIEVEIDETNKVEESVEINDIDNAPIVKMVNIMLSKAVASGASDIHIEPYEDCIMVRYRIDGQLMETMKHDIKILPSLIARIKIISGLNIAERRIPQDGRISLKIEDKDYDLRVSVLPTIFGEKVVIRIADKEGFTVGKKDLGFFDDDLQKFDQILANPHGIVLVTGPTGSGKSTTLYTALREIAKPNINILTVEDPVESIVRGVNQVQVNVKAGLNFATALRSFLRQDPDIIMVGEIRDAETAEIAIRAAITGHLVLSTLHTNDAASSINRLIDMGIEPFMLSSSIVGVIAQRLVRRLCPKCKHKHKLTADERELLNIASDEEAAVYTPKGCSECNNTGYKGRIAVYEIMSINKVLRNLITKNTTSDILKNAAIESGMYTLRDNCIRLVKAGVTSVEEMFRVTYSKD